MNDELLDTGRTVATPNNPTNTNHPPINIPNSGGILAMGILSIVLAGGIGCILGIIALALSGKATRDYQANPDKYRPGSYSNLKGGKVCAIIGLSLTVLVVIIAVAVNL